eukprot:GHRR01016009.1.p1 GENE.GHRR01016009.1~~GHRR01016009.1.p1  ORF type:complete len:151 (+),score=29.76 GHRR01016009.1:272-724(+)
MAATGLQLEILLVVTFLLLVPRWLSPVAADDWRSGRATYYGNEPWYWSIHYGSCGRGYIWPDQGTGWDVAALADSHPDWPNSCGSCYEVKCDDKSIKDAYGQNIDRSNACKDTSASVVVQISDTCPCDFPANAYRTTLMCRYGLSKNSQI